ncbi:MAG: hypothetical protein HQ510_11530 [Candidatus Marinimicrobia bacterium]|nr:hypothetical protein [Candidatus Neomarinimicrobiota bacterium]
MWFDKLTIHGLGSLRVGSGRQQKQLAVAGCRNPIPSPCHGKGAFVTDLKENEYC